MHIDKHVTKLQMQLLRTFRYNFVSDELCELHGNDTWA